MYVANLNRDRIHRTHLQGPCDLAIEVVSSESRIRDTVEKFREYAQGGVPEYWLLDAETHQTRFYALDNTGSYQEMPVSADGVFRSRVLPGLWLNVNWFWQCPVLTVRELLRLWNLYLQSQR